MDPKGLIDFFELIWDPAWGCKADINNNTLIEEK